MNQGIIAAILSIIFYLTSLLGGSSPETTPVPPAFTSSNQQTVSMVLGKRAVVLGDKAALRSGPNTSHPAITALNKGTEVTILQAENGWYKVRYASNRDGWIAGSSVQLLSTEPVENDEPMVLGYYFLGGQSFAAMLEQGQTLTSISPWSWALNANGELTGDIDPRVLGESLLFAGNHGLETFALIHNYSGSSFDGEAMRTLLTDPAAQARAIYNIKDKLMEWGVHGVHLDLENVPAELSSELTAFVAEVSETLKKDDLKTSIAVPAQTTSGAYDYGALAEHVDFMVIMAYNQHYRTGSPGPVAGADWVEKVVQYALSQVPKDKIVLGVPGYGYDWPQEGEARSLTHSEAMELAATEGVKVRWHSQHKVPYFTYGDGHQVWFENRHSLQAKLQIVEDYGLKGIALWRLGQEDSGIWKLIEASL